MTGAFLNLPQPDITAEPEVRTNTKVTGEPYAVVDLGDNMHVTMHIFDAAHARALAAAFTKAAELLDQAVQS